MSLPLISAQAARQLQAQGAWLIDIRAPDEHARERMAGARSMPMERLGAQAWGDAPAAVVFHCRSGNRTRLNAQALAAALPPGCVGHVLDGGLDAWKAEGLPVLQDSRQPLALQRQVQLGAGGLALLGAVLGATVSPWWHLLSAFVGCGLIVAGATGFCGLARMLMKAPWNRRALGQ
jgi:rhodanese-related sulfurtransferase